MQWKAVLHAGTTAPSVDSVLLNYLPKNVAPDFDDVTVQVGVRYQPLPKPSVVPDTSGTAAANPQPRFDAPPPTTRDSDSIGVKWTVHDDNDDQMVYSVYYRGDGETRWLLLKDNLTDKFYSFDASLLPDGGYTVEDHGFGCALAFSRAGADFDPRQRALRSRHHAAPNRRAQGSRGRPQIHVTFRAVDGFSNIKRAEYSVDAADWQYVEPVGQLADSKTANYDFQVAVPAGGNPATDPGKISAEHVVVVRVYDRFDNMSSAKTLIRGK